MDDVDPLKYEFRGMQVVLVKKHLKHLLQTMI